MHEQAPGGEGREGPERHADEDHGQGVAQNEAHDVSRGGAEGHAHTYFRNALIREVGQHAVNSDAGEQQSQAREYPE